MQIKFAKKFKKQYEKASIKIKDAFDKRFELFKENPYQLSLNNHQLTGKYSGKKSINITGDWRAIYSETIESGEKLITFNILGTHSQLYK